MENQLLFFMVVILYFLFIDFFNIYMIGPGGGIQEYYRQFFDPNIYRLYINFKILIYLIELYCLIKEEQVKVHLVLV